MLLLRRALFILVLSALALGPTVVALEHAMFAVEGLAALSPDCRRLVTKARHEHRQYARSMVAPPFDPALVQAITKQTILRPSDIMTLDLRVSGLQSLTGLEACQRLKSLNLSNWQNWRNDDGRPLTNMDWEWCGTGKRSAGPDNRTGDLEALRALSSLETLDLGGSVVVPLNAQGQPDWKAVPDWSVLAGMPKLKRLTLRSARIDSLAPLQSLANLESLDCFNTQIHDLTPLCCMPKLRELYLGSTAVTDLAPLRQCQALEVVDLGSLEITDLTPLLALPKLRLVNVSEAGPRTGQWGRGSLATLEPVLDQLAKRGVTVMGEGYMRPATSYPGGDWGAKGYAFKSWAKGSYAWS